MVSPAPSEEERRLLREYRLISIPSRRSSLSPATSSVASGTNSESATTTNSITNTTSASNSSSINTSIGGSGSSQSGKSSVVSGGNKTNSGSSETKSSEATTNTKTNKIGDSTTTSNQIESNHRLQQDNGTSNHPTPNTSTSGSLGTDSNNKLNGHQGKTSLDQKQLPLQIEIQTQTPTTQLHSHGSSTSTSTSSSRQHRRHKHHHHHHHHHNHHHSSNHRRHRCNSTPTQELTGDELNRILELVSGLTDFKLVSPKNLLQEQQVRLSKNATSPNTGIKSEDTQNNISINANGKPMTTTTINTKSIGTLTNGTNGRGIMKLTNGSGNTNCTSLKTNTMPTSNGTATATTKVANIFEKVDYIKKISIRRRAFKRLKKVKCQTN